MSLIFKNIYNFNDILKIDIYFEPLYGKICEISDNALWETCLYKDLKYVYLKKPYEFEGVTYYDLITPYGYSGFFFHKQETFKEFILLFRKEAKQRNYITEVLRQTPYLSLEKFSNYDIITSKSCFGVKLSNFNNFEEYLSTTNKNNRKSYKKAILNDLSFTFEEINENNLIDFKKIYEITMKTLKSDKYYYFSKDYYDVLLNELKKYIYIASVKKEKVIIASCMIFKYNNFLHYHIGGSLNEYRYLYPNNFLHCKVINYGIVNKMNLYILGCGVKNNDSLHKFKNRISNTKFDYIIYKNILNNEIYEKIIENYLKENTNHKPYFPIYRQ